MGDYTPSEQGEILSDLVAMYRAGTQDIPAKGEKLADIANSMSAAIDGANGHLTEMGFPGPASDMIAMMKDCHAGIVRSIETLNDIGEAIISIADDFAARDEYASSVVADLDDELKVGNTPVPIPPPLDDDVEESPFGGTMPSGPYLPSEVGN